ncbi:NUC185 domain-containing protein [Dipodascopsis uninucleata]
MPVNIIESIESIRSKVDLLDNDVLHLAKPIIHPNENTVGQSQEVLIKELEDQFLKPTNSFAGEWLDKLQETPNIDIVPLYPDLFDTLSTISRTSARFRRKGLEGAVIGYEHYTTSEATDSETSKNSSSFARNPATKVEFVRGKAGFMPFIPGGEVSGLDKSLVVNLNSLAKRDENGLLNTAPGLPRGMYLRSSDVPLDRAVTELENAYEKLELESFSPEAKLVESVGTVIAEDGTTPEIGEQVDVDMIDDLLPTENIKSLFQNPFGKSYDTRDRGHEWAHTVDVNTEITNFDELVPQKARDWPFELDTFQKEAIYHLEQGDSVFVAAHTSAGKTVVAEYAIAMANRNMTKAIYTSPIKALSNQKFRDFKKIFDDVGILTGDVQINPQASCVIMTTEILRSMLYRGADLIRDVEFVIFDEIHYVNDLERGVVWEEVIIMLPDHVKMILLSATVPNTYEFASWVGRTKRKDIYVISTPKRPVPLEHFLWANNQMYKIIDENKKFIMQGWSDAERAVNPIKTIAESNQKQSRRGGRGDSRGGGRGGRGGITGGRGGTTGGRGGSYVKSSGFKSNTFDKNMWLRMSQSLKKMQLLPVVIFVLSKRRCEEYANSLAGTDFSNASDKAQIHIFIENAVSRLKKEDQILPQILRMREMLSRGIAVHHGGLLPIVKEVVEILFAKSLVKVLFATETFAMGLNLPTKTVVFSGIRKHDGRSFRNLSAGEYTQMAGRAGRRGLDTTGTVIIAFAGDQPPDIASLNTMILGPPTKLQSQFRLTYNMILNLLRVEALKVEEMIKRSFSENATQSMIPEHEKAVKESEVSLQNFRREPCAICDKDLQTCHDVLMTCKDILGKMIDVALETSIGRKMLTDKRLAVLQLENATRTVCVITSVNMQRKVFHCYALSNAVRDTNSSDKNVNRNTSKKPEDFIPFIPELKPVLLDSIQDGNSIIEVNIPIASVEFFTSHTAPIDFKEIENKQRQAVLALMSFLKHHQSMIFDEIDWKKLRNFRFSELRKERAQCRSGLQGLKCVKCEKFPWHFTQIREESMLRSNIEELKQIISDQNLELLPEYEQRIEVLKILGFIDDNMNVELKGRVACEINRSNELILTELILDNFLADYEPEEIVALLSCFVFREKINDLPGPVTPKLDKGQAKILEIAKRVDEVQISQKISVLEDDVFNEQRFGLMEVVYEWARGMPFNRITDLTEVLEGTIVRVITQLDEVCREVKSASRIIGDPTLYAKMELSQEKIRRDIVFCTSLYL